MASSSERSRLSGGHRLEGVVGDHVQLVHDRQRRVPPLQRARIRWQREQGRVGVRLQQVVLEDLHPGVQRRVELHHPPGGVEDDPGLPLVGGDTDHLGALHPVGQQPVQPQGGRQGALAVAGRDRDERLARPRLVQHAADDLALPRAKLQAPAGTGALRNGDIALDEGDGARPAALREPPKVERRRRDGAFGACLHRASFWPWTRPTP
jgi:hypothetical protein